MVNFALLELNIIFSPIRLTNKFRFSNMVLKIINEDFSVCKVADYKGINLSSPYIFIGSTDEEKSLVCPMQLVPDNTQAMPI